MLSVDVNFVGIQVMSNAGGSGPVVLSLVSLAPHLVTAYPPERSLARGLLLKCCFTATETVRLLGTGAQLTCS